MDSIHIPQRTGDKGTTETASSVSFLDIYLKYDVIGHLSTRLYDKWIDFNFAIIKFPNFDSN